MSQVRYPVGMFCNDCRVIQPIAIMCAHCKSGNVEMLYMTPKAVENARVSDAAKDTQGDKNG